MNLPAIKKDGLASIISAVAAATNLGDAQEARARVEAIKAWAKAHGRVKEMRLDLLRVEVAALVRIVELGGIDSLPSRDREAAKWLASMDPADRERVITESGSATTAAGMCRTIWQGEENARLRRESAVRARSWTAKPPEPDNEDDLWIAEHKVNMTAAIRRVVKDHTEAGVPFEAADLAAEVLEEAGGGESWAEDEAVASGIREVVREALRRQPVLCLEGLVIPRTIVAQLPDGKFLRVPTENATVGHLDSTIRLRREQIAADQAALAKLEDFRARIGAVASETRIGDVLVDSIRQEPAA